MVVFLFFHSITVLGLIVFVSQVIAVPLAVSFFILYMYVFCLAAVISKQITRGTYWNTDSTLKFCDRLLRALFRGALLCHW